MVSAGHLICVLLAAVRLAIGTVGGCTGAETRARGIDLAVEAGIWGVEVSSSGTHPGIGYSYDETASDRANQYNGRVYDPGTGFHDYGARMYWPQIGRFISADSYQGDIGNPASLNRYAYVLNNPYKYTDPTGHCPSCIILAGELFGWQNVLDYQAGGALGLMEGLTVPLTSMEDGSLAYALGRGVGQGVGGAAEFLAGASGDVAGVATGPGELAIAPASTALAAKGAASIFLATRVRPSKPSSPGRMNQEVESGSAPRDVDAVHGSHTGQEEPHVHYTDGTSSTQSGGVHDAHRGDPNPPKKTRRWLEGHGWEPPPPPPKKG